MSTRCVHCGACASRGHHEACDRDAEVLGRAVHEAWLADRRANRLEIPQRLAVWDNLPEPLRATARWIGMTVAREVWR